MLDFKPDRLGHACYLNPDLQNAILEREIPIEICLTSNVITKSVSEYKTHHFQQFFMAGHPVSICVCILCIVQCECSVVWRVML